MIGAEVLLDAQQCVLTLAFRGALLASCGGPGRTAVRPYAGLSGGALPARLECLCATKLCLRALFYV
jgi:hypothetical protein